MSTAFASDDGWEPIIGLAASQGRAFLHALAAKLHRTAQGVLHGVQAVAQRIGHAIVAIAQGAASTVQIAFTRGGLHASISLAVTAIQVTRYAAGTVAAFLHRALDDVTETLVDAGEAAQAWLRSHRITTSRSPWLMTIPLLVAAIVIVGTAVLRRRTRTSVTEAGGRTWDLSDDDRQDLMSHLYVVLATDGSVRVHGIPEGWAKQTRHDLANVAARAAEQRLEMLVSRGRALTSLDLQAINVAARSAVGQELGEDRAAA